MVVAPFMLHIRHMVQVVIGHVVIAAVEAAQLGTLVFAPMLVL